MRPPKPLRILGVMTGTSCDGLDAACIEFSPNAWNPLWSRSIPYPAALRKKVLAFQLPGTRVDAKGWLELHRDLGHWYANAIRSIVGRAPSAAKPDLIANHGQTLAHFPSAGMTLQMGEPTRIALETGITVACQFRDGDLAAGGEGAPLVPRFHQQLVKKLGNSRRGIAIHNLGGISNLTYMHGETLLAFDTGPANIWIDQAVGKISRGKKSFDAGGKIAATGMVDRAAARAILRHPYFSQRAPKSTGRDDFPFEFFRSRTRAQGASLVATATYVTAASVADAYKRFILRKMPLQEIYFCGGGARNTTLLKMIRAELPGVEIHRLSDRGFDDQLIEAQAFAYFGGLSVLGQSLGGSWTRSKDFGPPAHLIPGKNWKTLLNRIEPLLRQI